ncbi:DUF2079 domain-containing protein [Candidatus Woesearchaeota archaeon]|nr:DUF2079 domain-containing protein [Candidatus Woesearchaeota archaeon]
MDRRILVMVAVYIVIMSCFSVLKYESFSSTALDLGLYDNMVWQFSHFKYGFNTVGGHYPFETHIMPILFLLVPFYWICQSPVTILIIQTVVIAFGALALYLIVINKLKSRILATAFAAAYLLNPTIHYTNLFDFHSDALGISFFLFAIYFIHREKWKLFGLFALLGGLTKEYAPLTITMLGVYTFFLKRKKVIAAVAAALGAAWFYANVFLSSLGKVVSHRYIGDFSWLGDNTREVIIRVLTRPDIVLLHLMNWDTALYLLLMLAPGLWLSVFAPEVLLLAAPSAALVLLHDSFSYTQVITHHNSFMMPFIFLAAVYGVVRYKNIAKKFRLPVFLRTNNSIAVAVIATAVIAYAAYGPFTILYDAEDINPFSEQAKAARAMIKQIPEDASVSAMTWAVPLLNHRDEIYTFPNPIYRKDYGREPWVTGYAGGEVDYVLINTERKEPLMNESFRQEVTKFILESSSYEKISENGGWVLLRKRE